MASKGTGSIGGSTTQVQFNNAGVLGGSASLTWSGTVLTSSGFAGPFNGTVGATTANTGAFTTLSASSTVSGTGFSTYLASPPAIGGTAAAAGSFTTLTTSSTITDNGGTANGVTYLNGSKVVTSGSALTFDGANFAVNSGYIRANNPLGYYTTLTATGLTNFATTMDFDSVSSYSFKISSAEQMRLTSTGLGIGTSSPAVKLDVGGGTGSPAIRINGANTSSAGPYLQFARGGTQTNLIGTYSAVASGTANDLTYYSASGYGHIWFSNGQASSINMNLDSSGNLGLGVTPSAWTDYRALQVGSLGSIAFDGGSSMEMFSNVYYASGAFRYISSSASAKPTRYAQGNGVHYWYNAPSGTAGNAITFTQAMTLDASGNLGVGTSSPVGKLEVNGLTFVNNTGSSTGRFLIRNSTTGASAGGLDIQQVGVDASINNSSNGYMSFSTNNTERARIDTSGSLLVGCTGGGSSGIAILSYGSGGDIQKIWSTQASSPSYSLISMFSNATNPASPTGTLRVNIMTNGGIANYQANDTNLSDRREKTNFSPSKSYLDVICAIPVQTFSYIDQNLEEDAGLTLGVVAQDVQAVAPELVMESNWGTEEDPKMRLSIYQTDLQYALMKALQELKAEFDAYKAAHP
jgi:hypothetical protein